MVTPIMGRHEAGLMTPLSCGLPSQRCFGGETLPPKYVRARLVILATATQTRKNYFVPTS